MINKITSYPDGGTISVSINIPEIYITLFNLPKCDSYEICRDFRVGIKTNTCGGDIWLGYPGKDNSINLSDDPIYYPLISWINDRLSKHVKYLQEDITQFITAKINN